MEQLDIRKKYQKIAELNKYIVIDIEIDNDPVIYVL